MVWLNQIIFWIPLAVAVIVLLWLWRKIALGEKIAKNSYRRIVIFVLIVFLLRTVGQIILFYFNLKNSSLGNYLLPGKGTNYFYSGALEIGKPFFYGLICAITLALIVFLINRYANKPWFEENDIYVFFLTGFLVGFPGVFVLILASLILMIIWQLIFRIQRINFAPFLLFVSILILILNNLSFYQQFLNKLHLI